jgi:hypothetical protein
MHVQERQAMQEYQIIKPSIGAWTTNAWFIAHRPGFWIKQEMRRQEPNPDVNEPPPDVNTPPPDVIEPPPDDPVKIPPEPTSFPDPDQPDPPPEGDPPPDEPARILAFWPQAA